MIKKYFGKLLLTSMVVFGLAACGGTPSAATTENAASTPEESMEATQLPEASAIPSQEVRESTLLNLTYPSTYTSDGTAAMVDGQYSEEASPGSASMITVKVGEYAFGDLNDDGLQDAAVILISETGGSGTFFDLVGVNSQDGNFTVSDPIYLGDRIQVKSIAIHDGMINLTYLTQGPDDNMASPTEEMAQSYTLQDGALQTDMSSEVGSTGG